MAKDVKGILSDFLKIDGVTAAAVVGRDGFVIESATSMKIDLEGLGAIVASGIGASENMGTELNLGALSQYLIEFDRGKVMIAAAGDDILAVVTDASAVIGSVRFNVKKGIDDLVKAL